MTKILVTGSLGFIGSHLCAYYVGCGYEVFGWNIESKPPVKVTWLQKTFDLLDYNKLKFELNEVKPDIVIHCAGLADVGKSVINPILDYNTNVSITNNLLVAVHQTGLRNTRFVFLSSAAVYGNPTELPIRENALLNPLSPYALHKLMCEDICRYYHSNDSLDVKIIRIFSAYGVGLRKQIFWDMYRKYREFGCLPMFGTGYESRDYINIEDLIQAIHLIVTKAPREELVYNVANGEEILIRTVAEAFADAVGLHQNKIYFDGQRQEGNPINWRADINKLKSLGYRKTIELQTGIKEYIEWVDGLET